MENFVSVILKNGEIDENSIVEAMLDALDAPLAERIQDYGLFESDNDTIVLRLVTPYELDEDESNDFAEKFSNHMFEMGYDDFEIETSLTEAVLKRGAKGAKVKKLQYDLGVQPADGDFGPATEKAVKKFQKLYQLKPDGIVGPNTQKMINKTVSISLKDKPEYFKSVPKSDFGAISAFRVSRRGGLMNNPKQVDSIKELQAELKRRNMYKGPIDGKYGPDTRDSVASFQKTKGLYVDGDAGPKTILALMNRDDKITSKELEPVKQPDQGTYRDASTDDELDFGELPPGYRAELDGKKVIIYKNDQPVGRYNITDQDTKRIIADVRKIAYMNAGEKMPGGTAYADKGDKDGKKFQTLDGPGSKVDVVEPRPKGSGVIQDYAKNDWDKKYGKTHNPDGTPKSNKDDKDEKFDLKRFEKFLGMKMYTSNKDVVKDLQGNTEDENRKIISLIAKKYKRRKKFLSKKEQAIMLQSIVYIMDYDMRLDYSEKTYKGLKKKIASLKETVENKVGMFEETYDGDEFYEMYGWIGAPDEDLDLWEAEYRGRKVKLNKPMQGDVKKFKVYVKNPKGNIIKVNFGDPNMRIKKSNPKRRKSFRARHNCDNPGPKTKARYWSCRKW
tara:strand:- start:1460 stop:3304 length:1845 start_codon:yes stop_codon:yes gene_type:complete